MGKERSLINSRVWWSGHDLFVPALPDAEPASPELTGPHLFSELLAPLAVLVIIRALGPRAGQAIAFFLLFTTAKYFWNSG